MSEIKNERGTGSENGGKKHKRDGKRKWREETREKRKAKMAGRNIRKVESEDGGQQEKDTHSYLIAHSMFRILFAKPKSSNCIRTCDYD